MKTKITMIGNGLPNSISDDLFDSVIQGRYPDISYAFAYSFPNRLIKLLNKVYYSPKLYKVTGSLRLNWEKYYTLEKLSFDKSRRNILIINLGSVYYWFSSASYIKKFKEANPDIILVLLLIDTIDTKEMLRGNIKEWFPLFDHVITFDPQDAKKYGLAYRMLPYMEREPDPGLDSEESDIYFVGRDKGRGEFLNRICEKMVSCGVRTNFKIIGSSSAPAGRKGMKFLREKISYDQVIADVKGTNCVLEILSHGAGSTLRYYEAVIYNKKLLSNNPGIVDLPHYDSRYMKCFSTAEDIDCGWLQKKEPISYDYRGEFGLEAFFKFVSDLCSE